MLCNVLDIQGWVSKYIAISWDLILNFHRIMFDIHHWIEYIDKEGDYVEK